MTRHLSTFVLCLGLTLGLAACGSGQSKDTNPFQTNNTTTDDTTGGSTGDQSSGGTDNGTGSGTNDDTAGEPTTSTTTKLPGTVNPSSRDQIVRREARNESDGDGFATGFRYDANTDKFFVDNIAFDGEDGYTAVRNAQGQRFGMGPFNVFESPAKATDILTSADVSQLQYRALFGIGPDGNTSIAIVRTGGYVEFGFGGFIYQRNGAVILPTSGQAFYTGTNNYGGLRDFKGRGGLEYVNGDAEVFIDFDDFNSGAGVRGVIKDRRVFNMAGDDITADILQAFGNNATQMPNLQFVIQPGVLDANGEMSGKVQSINPGDGKEYENGSYFAVLSGPSARTITGVIVATAKDPRNTDHTVRETGGFFATRK